MCDKLDHAWDALIHCGVEFEGKPPELAPDDAPPSYQLDYYEAEEDQDAALVC